MSLSQNSVTPRTLTPWPIKLVFFYEKKIDKRKRVFSEKINDFVFFFFFFVNLQQYDQKNIRRRVYDALNVLMAMDIISKEKKEIRWLGLPINSLQECSVLEKDKMKKIERIKAKTQQLHQLILQHISFKNLVERNCLNESLRGPPKPNSAIQLPFLIVNTSKKTVIDCSISNDKYVEIHQPQIIRFPIFFFLFLIIS